MSEVFALGSFITDFWNDQLAEHDRQWLFLVLVGLVVSFGFIRFSTRMMRSPNVPWWPGSVVSESGLHVHHLVFGIVLMIAAGTISFAGFAVSPIYEICAFLFGIGIGLTIDEFALLLYLDDVYWAKEGRASIDATVIAVAALGLVLLGVRPFDIDDGSAGDLIVSIVARRSCSAASRSASSRAGSCTRSSASSSSRWRSTAPAGSASRTRLGAALLRRAQPEEAGEGRGALRGRPPHRAVQGRRSGRSRRHARGRVPRQGRATPRGQGRTP